ncbi:MAG: lysoplasmalogenase [Myxococcales bacterium]|nr:lysoplasmalogenase [Myxococcales bacterium]
MTQPLWTALATVVGLVLLLVFGERTGSVRNKVLIKPLTSVGFIATAVLSGCMGSVWGQWILVGLVLSFFGDVLLISSKRAAFLAGLVAFLLGHVAYVGAFYQRGIDVSGGVLPALAVGAVAIGLVARWLLPKVDKKMMRPVIAYMVVITLMVAFAGGTVAAKGQVWLLVGAVMFWLSDISVATDRFAGGGLFNRVWGLSFYYIGQLILALSSGGA